MDVKGFLIKKLKEENLTQTALAKKLNLSQPCINKILHNNSSVSLDTLQKIAIAYRLPVSFFLGGKEHVEESEITYKIKHLLGNVREHDLVSVYQYLQAFIEKRSTEHDDARTETFKGQERRQYDDGGFCEAP